MELITGKFFEAILLFALEVSFDFMGFLSSIVLLFLSSFVLRSLCSILSVYSTINELIRMFFTLSSSLKKYTTLCKVSICDQCEDITPYAPVKLFLFRLYNFRVPLRRLS